MFQRDESADGAGAYLAEDVDLIPLFLVSKFGRPSEGDGLRVSGIYTFTSEKGVVFTVHDYKNTTLWAADEGLPTPEQFWASQSAEEFSVGSKGEPPEAFITWLLSEQERWASERESRLTMPSSPLQGSSDA